MLGGPALATAPLVLGSAVTGSIASPGDQAVYTFDATKGQRVFYSPSGPVVGSTEAWLFDPFGSQVFDINWGSTAGPIDLAFTGTYRLVFSAVGNTTGSYGFTLRSPALATAPLVLGSAVTGSIASPGDQAVYTFDATKGQRVFYSPSGPVLGLPSFPTRRPSDLQVFDINWGSTAGPIDLAFTGTYRLVF